MRLSFEDYILRTNDIYYNLVDMFVLYIGLLVVSLFFGFIATITIELPFANMLKVSPLSRSKIKKDFQTVIEEPNTTSLLNENL